MISAARRSSRLECGSRPWTLGPRHIGIFADESVVLLCASVPERKPLSGVPATFGTRDWPSWCRVQSGSPPGGDHGRGCCPAWLWPCSACGSLVGCPITSTAVVSEADDQLNAGHGEHRPGGATVRTAQRPCGRRPGGRAGSSLRACSRESDGMACARLAELGTPSRPSPLPAIAHHTPGTAAAPARPVPAGCGTSASQPRARRPPPVMPPAYDHPRASLEGQGQVARGPAPRRIE